MDCLLLTGRRAGVGVGLEIRREERFAVFAVSVERQEERGPLLHEAHSGVSMSVDAPLVSLGLSKESLQVQIVLRQVQEVASGKYARRETSHHSSHVLAERMGIRREPELDLVELRPALFRGAVVRIEGHLDGADVLDLSANLLLVLGDRGKPFVDAPGEPVELLVRVPPF